MKFIVAFYTTCSMYDPPRSDLFYDIYNTINEDNQRQTHYLSSILNYFDINF